jgi:phosphoenolpyruvate-protein kinase (PTS system EI component)
MKTGIELIAEERREQIEKHKHSIEEDRKYNGNGELILAVHALLIEDEEHADGLAAKIRVQEMPAGWDYDACVKMAKKTRLERLVIAGALIAAEIDSMDHEEWA